MDDDTQSRHSFVSPLSSRIQFEVELVSFRSTPFRDTGEQLDKAHR